ncbi:hypothetical protein [Streptomyces sp. NPDC001781]
MAWTAPMTAVAGSAFTAAQFNQHVRDNLNETAPAKATAEGQIFVSTGANQIAARQMAKQFVGTSQTTTATTYSDLTTIGPRVTVATGTRALCMYACSIDNTSTNGASKVSVAVTGASSIAADDQWCMVRDGANSGNVWRISMSHMFETLTPGTNTFTMRYLVGSGTGTFLYRELIVIPF